MKKIIALISIIGFTFLSAQPWFAATFNTETFTKKFAPTLSEDNLTDVTKRSTVRGIRTASRSWGYAEISYENWQFGLFAGFHDLSAPRWDDFYEGWLVQRDPFKFISTGKLERQSNGDYLNVFESDIDYSSYDFYVLTLEPNDGDPAPADHIFEGEVVVKDYSVVNNIFVKNLNNVTDGKIIKGLITPKRASGYAQVDYQDRQFSLEAVFDSLGTPKWDDFYEGWLVQRDPFKFISTGELQKRSLGQYVNNFTSDTNYLSYDFYVLTLEPNDGDPAPADHIFEGEVVFWDIPNWAIARNSISTTAQSSSAVISSKNTTKSKVDIVAKSTKKTQENTVSRWLTSEQEQKLRSNISSRLDTLDIDHQRLLDRILDFKKDLDNTKFSDTKKRQYEPVLKVLIEILEDKIAVK